MLGMHDMHACMQHAKLPVTQCVNVTSAARTATLPSPSETAVSLYTLSISLSMNSSLPNGKAAASPATQTEEAAMLPQMRTRLPAAIVCSEKLPAVPEINVFCILYFDSVSPLKRGKKTKQKKKTAEP